MLCCPVVWFADRLKKMAIKSNSGSTGTAAAGKAPAGRTAARAAARAAVSQLAVESDEGGSDFEDDLEVRIGLSACFTAYPSCRSVLHANHSTDTCRHRLPASTIM